jgi:hypothetical protein
MASDLSQPFGVSSARYRRRWRRTALLLCPILLLSLGCAAGRGPTGQSFTRRGSERTFISTPQFGGARGRTFEDVIPVGARITTVHVGLDGDRVTSIWTTYERNGVVKDTPHRGHTSSRVEKFKLGRKEKLVGIHAYGRGEVGQLVIATNKRTRLFGTGPATDEPAWFDSLSDADLRSYVGVGFTGRADRQLQQLSLRIQVRQGGYASAD